MVSRRKILSRSRDDLNTGSFIQNEEDVWYQKDKLYRVSCKPSNKYLMKLETLEFNEPYP